MHVHDCIHLAACICVHVCACVCVYVCVCTFCNTPPPPPSIEVGLASFGPSNIEKLPTPMSLPLIQECYNTSESYICTEEKKEWLGELTMTSAT